MGTNYYVKTEPEQSCQTCGHITGGNELHIGKSSLGWAFALNAHPSKGLTTFNDWEAFLSDHKDSITDEYGRQIPLEELMQTITKRSHYRGLLRHDTDFPSQWERGDGTYDIARFHIDFS